MLLLFIEALFSCQNTLNLGTSQKFKLTTSFRNPDGQPFSQFVEAALTQKPHSPIPQAVKAVEGVQVKVCQTIVSKFHSIIFSFPCHKQLAKITQAKDTPHPAVLRPRFSQPLFKYETLMLQCYPPV